MIVALSAQKAKCPPELRGPGGRAVAAPIPLAFPVGFSGPELLGLLHLALRLCVRRQGRQPVALACEQPSCASEMFRFAWALAAELLRLL